MLQRQMIPTLARLQAQGWDRLAIRNLILVDHKSWLENIETLKMESARNFDNQLHSIQSTWPLFNENNEPILTGYMPVSPELRKSVLKRDHYTCRICCRRQFYCLGEERRNSPLWYTYASIDLQVHHIIPLPSGPNTSNNLMALCKRCHERLHAYYTKSRKDRGIFEAVFHSFHKCLKYTVPIPGCYPNIAEGIDSFLIRLTLGFSSTSQTDRKRTVIFFPYHEGM